MIFFLFIISIHIDIINKLLKKKASMTLNVQQRRHLKVPKYLKYMRIEAEYEKYNCVNIKLSESEKNITFKKCESKKEFARQFLNILASEIHKNNRIVKLFDFIILNIEFVNMIRDTDRGEEFIAAIKEKLFEFSKHRLFGPRRAKYYERILFPENKCCHITPSYICVYKIMDNSTRYCKSHYENVYVKRFKNLRLFLICDDTIKIILNYI